MLQCEVIETNYCDAETMQQAVVYGLRFYAAGNRAAFARVVPDIFCKRAQATRAMQQINAEGICAVHIDEIIENLLA